MAKKHSEKQTRVALDRLKEKLESQEIKLHATISHKGRKPSRFEQDPYNEYQNFLYNRALFGLGVYSKEEVAVMHWDKKKRIIKVHKRAQTLINIWKQEIVNALSNYFFNNVFPGTPITEELHGEILNGTDELHINKMSFKTLRIKKEQVVERFINDGILPRNFNELTPTKEKVVGKEKQPKKLEHASQEKTL